MGDWDRMRPGKGTPWPSQEIDSIEPLQVEHVRRGLHWFQWLTYIIVILTCVAVLITIVNTYVFIGHIQNAVQQLESEWGN
jgi:hypothetical protein